MNGAPSRAPSSGCFKRALPLEHGPAVVAVLRELAEDSLEVDLTVARRAETPRPIDPALVAAVDAAAAVRPKLGVFHVKRFDALVVEVDESGVVELLQQEVARVVEDVRALMIADGFEETLERRAVVQVFAGMDLERDVDAGLVEGIENRPPAPCELLEPGFDEARRSLRPRVHGVPEQGAAEGRVRFELQSLARFRGVFELLCGPFLPRARLVAQLGGRERRELRRVRGMHGDELALEVSGELADDDIGVGELTGNLVAIGLALGRLLEVEQLRIRRDLHADIAEPSGPLRHRLELVERRRGAGKLRQEDRGALHLIDLERVESRSTRSIAGQGSSAPAGRIGSGAEPML